MSAVVTAASSRAGREKKTTATRIVVSAFGVLVAFAGVEHGVGEILQGSVRPPSVVIESWPDTAGFEILSGEPAMTLVPNMAVTGVLAIIAALAVGVWAVWFIQRPHGGLILIGLSVVLLLVGGGFGPPIMAAIIGVAATRIGKERRKEPGFIGSVLARAWPWLLGAGLVGYLGLVPGMVLVSRMTGFDNPYLVSGLMLVAFAGLILSLVAARLHDQLTGGRSS
ncbi:MAG TPA: hypothetical protein VLA91_04915 [Acidimicrobiia bacterium]|nr:hypothetical protein [Acidimicrobiia bacterium]